MGRIGQARIGISGWRYTPWRGTFYPETLTQKQELSYASRQLNFIEINGSFYSLQRPNNYIDWRESTPDDFLFSVKGGRYITHMLKLKNVQIPLANFCAQGILALGKKLGPFLWQFPPGFAFNADRFAEFFDLLPRTTTDMARIAAKHDARMKGRAFLDVLHEQKLRHCVEIRHPSFESPAFVELLREHKIGLVVADTAGKWPLMEDVTADFVYCRLHGDEELYVSGYTDQALDTWATKLKAWRAGREPAKARRVGDQCKPRAAGRDVYVAFDNDVKVRAPIDAIHLAERLGVAAGEARAHEHEARLSAIVRKKGYKPPRARENWPGFGRRRKAS